MTHFGVILPPVSGHLNPMAALGRELQQRGHRVTFFQIPDVASKVLAEGLEFCPIGQSDHPLGSLPQSVAQLGKLSGIAALRFTIRAIQKTTGAICRDAPGAIKQAGVEALLVDQTEPAGGTIAEFLGIPFVTICCALAINREASIPPIFTPWTYQSAWWRKLRNQAGYFLFDRITQPIQTTLAEFRQQWQLPPHSCHEDSFSQLAQISQQPLTFDFPRIALPQSFHYAGPLRNQSPRVVTFPYERLTGQPLIYASLGTLQNTKKEVFRCIAAACEKLDAQLVMSHGGGMSEQAAQSMPGNPLIVEYAPQLELLARAKLTVTHAGLNTVLDSLSNGVPLVTIPITYEQPAIAARLRWAKCGEVIALNHLSVSRLRALVQQVLTDDSYTKNAARLKESIRQAGGVKRAADIVEQAIATRQPVLSSAQT